MIVSNASEKRLPDRESAGGEPREVLDAREEFQFRIGRYFGAPTGADDLPTPTYTTAG